MIDSDALARLCQWCGIALSYPDIWGEDHVVASDTQVALLEAMGVLGQGQRDPQEVLAIWEERVWRRPIDPVLVVGHHEVIRVGIRLPHERLAATLSWELVEEGGGRHSDALDPSTLPVADRRGFAGIAYVAVLFELPHRPPLGYHDLYLTGGGLQAAMRIIVTPERCFEPAELDNDGRVWGPAVQLYAVRSRRGWGIGDFTDLKHLVDQAADLGAGIIGLNPLHALFAPFPERASPYSPSSRLFLNWLYLDVEAIPEFGRCEPAQRLVYSPAFRERLRSLRQAETVDYAGVHRAKREVLDILYQHFCDHELAHDGDAARELRAFIDTGGEALRRQAIHDTILEQRLAADPDQWGWPVWPEPLKDASSAAVESLAREQDERVLFFSYLQWRADEQLAEVARRARQRGVWLYNDMAVSCDRSGAEAWARRDLYANDVSIGAPPDDFNLQGQKWGLPPFIPHRLREAAYAPFVDALRANMRHAGALRIDHVMGMMRLFWVPLDATPADGAYVHYPLHDLLGILALESQRHQCLVIGEDLGTVPEEGRAALGPMKVLSYRLLYFEKDAEGTFRPPDAYPSQALAAISTHDLPTLAGYWKGEDIVERTELGLFTTDEVRVSQILARAEDRARLLVALKREGLLPEGITVDPASCPDMTQALSRAVHTYLARTPAKVMMVQLEDLLLQRHQANLPGTSHERANWCHRTSSYLEDWPSDDEIRAMAGALRRVREPLAARAQRPDRVVRVPRATYRIQLNAGFTFADAEAIVAYLDRLGISDLYASPYLKARSGSTHGYDIVDHSALNDEIGDEHAYRMLTSALRDHGMGQILDVVPNHMGVGPDNAWWWDVLENGPSSAYAGNFDIDWHPLKDELHGRVLLPVLGDHYGEVLDRGEITLCFAPEVGTFHFRYFEHTFPLDPHSYPQVLAAGLDQVAVELGQYDSHLVELQTLITAFRNLPPRSVVGGAAAAERGRDKEAHKQRLADLCRRCSTIRGSIERTVAAFNDAPGGRLHELLEEQAYRLAHWRVAADEINYRRFFDINELAGVRQENPEVFFATHRLIAELVARGDVTGLRIDHPDGLYDPSEYYQRLQDHLAPGGDNERELYVVAEKILASHEQLVRDWRVHGTTGYDFANLVGGLGVCPDAERELDRIYLRIIGQRIDFDELLYERKKLIMRVSLSSELHVLANQLDRISEANSHTRDFTLTALRDALVEVVACFPVYRTYVTGTRVSAEDRRDIEWAIARAKKRNPAAESSVFDFLRSVLLVERSADSSDEAHRAIVELAMRFQQYTAPVMAKGLEDTSFYIYNRLVSLNEVGGDPRRFGTTRAAFHRANQSRARYWPYAMLSTSTHDSKRSEDVRARINVITEIPQEWRTHLGRWSRINRSRRRRVDEGWAPSRNDEYLLYQTLLGVWPVGEEDGSLAERVENYMLKAVREAKVHTSWINPNHAYEEAVRRFVAALFANPEGNPFLRDFVPLCRQVTRFGFYSSLSQTLLKLTAPGVPDIYQGNELWDFSLVDPDNRRPVDYQHRQRLLDTLQRHGGVDDRAALCRELVASLSDGRAKLYLIWRALRLRARLEDVFTGGDYLPLTVHGPAADHVIAFVRQSESALALSVAPRWFWRLGRGDPAWPPGAALQGTTVSLPAELAGSSWHSELSGRSHAADSVDGSPALAVDGLLADFPVALLSRPRR